MHMEQTDQHLQPMHHPSQVILYNCKTKRCEQRSPSDIQVPQVVRPCHLSEFESPLLIYIGLNVHTQTRFKQLVTKMCELGISVSHYRVLHVEKKVTTAICESMKMKGVVYPVQLCQGLFTMGALDNLDNNPSRTTAKGFFHGTGTNLFQSPPASNRGHIKEGIAFIQEGQRTTSCHTVSQMSSCGTFQGTGVCVPSQSVTSKLYMAI